jgi:hypothetical protein
MGGPSGGTTTEKTYPWMGLAQSTWHSLLGTCRIPEFRVLDVKRAKHHLYSYLYIYFWSGSTIAASKPFGMGFNGRG